MYKPLGCCRKLLQVLAFQEKYIYIYTVYYKKFEQSFPQKCKPGLWMLDVFKLSVLAVGASKVPSIKTPALRLIHLLKSHRPIKTWAPLVICNICSIWQCELGRPADLLKFVSTEGCPPSLFSSSSSSYFQDLVGLFPYRNHVLALRNSKGPLEDSFAKMSVSFIRLSSSKIHLNLRLFCPHPYGLVSCWSSGSS